MRLLARVYADGNTPSKVSISTLLLRTWLGIDDTIVVAEFHEAQIHGQITIVASHWSSRKYSHLLKQYCLPVYL